MVHFCRNSSLEPAKFAVGKRQKYRSLVLFLPVSIEHRRKMDEFPAKYK